MRSRCFSGRHFPRKLSPDSLWIHTRHSRFLFRNGLPFFVPAAHAPAPAAPTSVSEAADDLLKLKELLDAGILTQEEFDAKKKQLLGL